MLIFIIVWLIWFISEIMLRRLLRSGEEDKKDQDKGSLRIIWIAVGIGNTLGIVSNIFFQIPIGKTLLVPYTGLSLIILGMIFRLIAIWTLGQFFTVDVTIRTDHKIKKDGFYRYIRHPSYTGMMLSFVGFGLSINNWLSLIIIIIPVFSAIFYRVKIEENMLVEQFGEEYIEYIKKVPMFIPFRI